MIKLDPKSISIIGIMDNNGYTTDLTGVHNYDSTIEYNGVYSLKNKPTYELPEWVSTYRYVICGYNQNDDTIDVTSSSIMNPIVLSIPFKNICSSLTKFNLQIEIRS